MAVTVWDWPLPAKPVAEGVMVRLPADVSTQEKVALLVPPERPNEEPEILDRTRRSYGGPVLLGHDLMSVAVGDTTATPRPRAGDSTPPS